MGHLHPQTGTVKPTLNEFLAYYIKVYYYGFFRQKT